MGGTRGNVILGELTAIRFASCAGRLAFDGQGVGR